MAHNPNWGRSQPGANWHHLWLPSPKSSKVGVRPIGLIYGRNCAQVRCRVNSPRRGLDSVEFVYAVDEFVRQ